MKTLEEFVNEKLKETGIEIGIWSHSILGYSCYVDTTKHDEEVIRKFIEWLYDHRVFVSGRTKEARISALLDLYKKRGQNDERARTD